MAIQPRTPAHAYQEYFGPAIFEPLQRHLLELAVPSPGEDVLDIACGTGIVTRAAAEKVGPDGRVTGVDINPNMIDVARSIPPPAGVEIEWLVQDATALDLPDASFDLVCCQQGLQFFPDRDAGAANMRRVLVDGGRAVVAVWRGLDANPFFGAIADAEEPHLRRLGAEFTRESLIAPFSFGDASALSDLLLVVGFRDVNVVQRTIQARFQDADQFLERLEYAYAAVIPAFSEDPAAFATYLEALAGETDELISGYRDGDEVIIPMHTNIAVAHA